MHIYFIITPVSNTTFIFGDTALYKTGKNPSFMELMFYCSETDDTYTGKFIICCLVINAKNTDEQCVRGIGNGAPEEAIDWMDITLDNLGSED